MLSGFYLEPRMSVTIVLAIRLKLSLHTEYFDPVYSSYLEHNFRLAFRLTQVSQQWVVSEYKSTFDVTDTISSNCVQVSVVQEIQNCALHY